MIYISIVTAVFNRRETISDTLNSVFSQTHPFVESIVIDGASTDGTLSVLETFKTKLGFLISEPDNGIYDALNKGIKHSTGEVIGFLHADDVFENHEVISRIAAIFQDSAVDAVYGDLVYVKEDNINQVIRYWKSGHCDLVALKRGWMPPHPTFYVRRSVYDRLGGFDTKYSIAADYDTVLRFLFVNRIHVAYIPEVLVRMRAGGISNRSFFTILSKSLEDFDVIRRNNVGGLFTLIIKNLRKINQFLTN
jgi:glycosyltransferase involved in cell wall biosynthesis